MRRSSGVSEIPSEVFKSLVEASLDFIGTIDKAWNFVYLNPAGRAMLEIPLDEDLAGHSIVPYNDKPSEALVKSAKAVLSSKLATAVSIFVTRSGRRIPVSQSFIVHETSVGTRYSTIARDISDRLAVEESLRFRADRDALTGLLNRAALCRLVAERVCNTKTHLAMLDLDGFKLVNDTHGHHVGDALLVDVATSLVSSLGEGALVARFGGDEFLVIADRDDLHASLHSTLESGLRAYGAGASIGVVPLSAADDLTTAMRNADAKLYNQKRTRSNRNHPLDSSVVEERLFA